MPGPAALRTGSSSSAVARNADVIGCEIDQQQPLDRGVHHVDFGIVHTVGLADCVDDVLNDPQLHLGFPEVSGVGLIRFVGPSH